MTHFLKYNNKSTEDFYLTLGKEVAFISPSRGIEFEKIKGIDGELALGDNSLKNINRNFPFKITPPDGLDIQDVATDLSNWLKQDSLWHDFEFSGDPDYIYQAIYVDEYNIERITGFYGKVVLSFVLKPYKFLKTGLDEITLGADIINPTNRPSRPKITIKGTGNITLKIGDALWEFKNVSGGIVVDTLLNVVTTLDGQNLAWDKTITYPLPKIAPGKQLVTKTGTITDIKIIPNWEVVVG